jgi:hypothetical protein
MFWLYAKITHPHLAEAADALDGALTFPVPTALWKDCRSALQLLSDAGSSIEPT